jgi:hypothetical protein
MEYRHGYRYPVDSTDGHAFFVSQRIRLNLGYTDSLVQTFLSIQDTRVWGDRTITSPEASFGLAEGWVQLHLAPNWFIKAGRQELSFGDQRLIGPAQWRQAARSHDVLLVSYLRDNWKWQLAGAYNQNAERLSSTSYGINQYKAMGVFQVERHKGNLTGYLLSIADGTQNLYAGNEEMDVRITNGLHVQYAISKLELSSAYYMQNGIRFIDGEDLMASMWNSTMAYSFGNWNVELGYDILSGQDSSSEKYSAFDNLYGSRHAFYGNMDYFISFPFDIDEGGLRSLRLNASYTCTEKHQFEVGFYSFQLDQPVRDVLSGQLTGRSLGKEFDFVYSFDIRDDVHLQFGQSFYITTEDLSIVKGGNANTTNYFSYLMLDVNPIIFRSGKNH